MSSPLTETIRPTQTMTRAETGIPSFAAEEPISWPKPTHIDSLVPDMHLVGSNTQGITASLRSSFTVMTASVACSTA